MKRLFLFTTIAIVTYGIIYFLRNPDELNKIWLYVVGLFGAIVKLFSVALDKIKSFLSTPVPKKKEDENERSQLPTPPAIVRG